MEEFTVQIFISYSRQDEDFASRLSEDLRNMGAETWRDRENIPAGSNWDSEIEQGIRNPSHFLLVSTPDSVASKNVMDEVSLAADLEKTIIPILLKNCDLPMRARRSQWVDFTGDNDEALSKLASELGLEKPVPHQVYKPYLDKLFAKADDLMRELAAGNDGCFTSQHFLKECARRNAIAYIELLHSTKEYYLAKYPEKDSKWIFNAAHQHIGSRLSSVAQKAGYSQEKGGHNETDIWGNPTGRVTYCA